MNAITMDNKTNNNISSRNKKRGILQNVLLVFNILLLAAAVVIAAMVLTGCAPKETEPENFPEAEAMVAAELESIKTSDVSKSALKQFAEIAEGDGEAYAEAYIDKLKDFDYEILKSQKVEDEEGKAIVRVRITTYDFGKVYLDTWTEYIEEERDWLRSEHQLYTNLLTRIISMNKKEFIQEVDIVCTDAGEGNWTCDIKGNETLMDAVSGGLLLQMKELAEEAEKSE